MVSEVDDYDVTLYWIIEKLTMAPNLHNEDKGRDALLERLATSPVMHAPCVHTLLT